MVERLMSFAHEGMTFDVVDHGPDDGEVVIALHGFPQTARSWTAVSDCLAEAGYRVLAPDQRGYSPGARPLDVASYAMDRLAGDVLALADAAGVDRFHVLGHDWGGTVAWHVAYSSPSRVRTVSVATTPHPRAMRRAFLGSQGLRSWYMALFNLPEVPELLLHGRDQAGLRRLLTSSGAPHPEESLRLMADRKVLTAGLNWYRATLRGLGPPTGRIPVPALFVWSDRDPAVGRRAAQLTGDYMSSAYTFAVLPGASHWIPEERPEELTDLLLAHLRRHSDAAPTG